MKPTKPVKKFGEETKNVKKAAVEISTETRTSTPTNPSIGSKVYAYNPFDSFDEDDESYGYLASNLSGVQAISNLTKAKEFVTYGYRNESQSSPARYSNVKNPFDDEEYKLENESNTMKGNDNKNPMTKDQEKTSTASSINNASAAQKSRSAFLTRSLRKMDKNIKQDGYGHSTTCIDSDNQNAVIRFLLSERVFGYPGSDGSYLSNYRHYVFNCHPLISIFFMNSQHPFERKRRIIVFLCTFAFTIFLSFVLLDDKYILTWVATCRSGCNKVDSPSPSNPSTAETICSGGYNDGLAYSRYDSQCHYYQPWMLSALCGAFTVIYGSLLRFLATCGCLQGRSIFQTNCIGSRFKAISEYCGGQVLAFFVFLSFILLVSSAVLCWLTGSEFSLFIVLIQSKIWSQVEWFVWSAPYFSFRYPMDRRYFYQRLLNRDQNNRQIELQSKV